MMVSFLIYMEKFSVISNFISLKKTETLKHSCKLMIDGIVVFR